MCINPRTLDTGQIIPCHICWQCRDWKVNDWVGRCIAEQKTSYATHVLTLTYGGDTYINGEHQQNIRARMLHYEDVQLYLKRLREVAKCRFLCAGEYGAKGRAHWHLVLFWKNKLPPDLRLGERYIHNSGTRMLWPHGWSYWEEPSPANLRYVCKYVLKEMQEASAPNRAKTNRKFSLSTRPPLGFYYFQMLARRYVEQGLSPQDGEYRFPDLTGDTKFYLRRASASHFARAFIEQWHHVYGNSNWPQSDWIDDHMEQEYHRDMVGEAPDPWFEYQWRLRQLERQGKWPNAGLVAEVRKMWLPGSNQQSGE